MLLITKKKPTICPYIHIRRIRTFQHILKPLTIILPFQFNTLNHALARCPHCRNVSSVGPDYARGKGKIFTIIGLLLLAVGVGVTAGTYAVARTHSGVYVAYVGAFLLGLIMVARGVYYCLMKVSVIEGPM